MLMLSSWVPHWVVGDYVGEDNDHNYEDDVHSYEDDVEDTNRDNEGDQLVIPFALSNVK